jgi:SAM-dependent methyltransferase
VAAGVDRNPRALTVAATAMPPDAPWWLLLWGDLAQPLPIATGSVDRVLCHNTLEALANPTGLLVEAHRVLRPGGGAVIGHSDFDTLVFDGADLALTRRLVHTYCDQRQPGWMDAVDGTIGRRLPALVSRSLLQVRQVHAQVLLEQAFAPWALGFMLAKGAVAVAAKSGRFTTAELDTWLASLQVASAPATTCSASTTPSWWPPKSPGMPPTRPVDRHSSLVIEEHSPMYPLVQLRVSWLHISWP